MKIMYTCDNNYIWFMGISLLSLLENNKNVNELEVYLLGKNLTEESKKIIANIASDYKTRVVFYDIVNLPIPEYLETNSRWTIICYARLFAGDLLKDVDRILYLDCDTIILDDLSELFSEKYNDLPVYGCRDFIGNWYKKLIGMPCEAVNVNGGVLLFNLKKMRDMDSTKMIDNFLNLYGKYISYADQDILNGTFWRTMGVLDASYNVMSIMKVFKYKEIVQLKHPQACCTEEEVKKAIENPKIIHFTGNYRVTRPWFKNSNHPYKDEFEKYKTLSPWNDKELIEEKNRGEVALANKIRKLPSWFSCNLLGFLYCVIRPVRVAINGKIKK